MNIVMDQKELVKIIEAHIHSRLHDPKAKLKVTFEANTLGVKANITVVEIKPRPFEENYA
jgi:hypothetical protein